MPKKTKNAGNLSPLVDSVLREANDRVTSIDDGAGSNNVGCDPGRRGGSTRSAWASWFYEILMRRYNLRVYRVARTILRDDAEAEDVMQETYVRAYQHLHQFAG